MAAFELRIWELVCYCFIFVVGLIGNLVVCLVVWKSGREFRQVPFNVYLMSLAVVDLVQAVVCLPVYIMSTSIFPHPTGNKGDIFCKLVTGYAVPFWLAGVSIYMLVFISFERYTAICKPFEALANTTSKKTALCIISAWLIGLVIQIPTSFGIHFSDSKPACGNFCRYDWPNTVTSAAIYASVVTAQYIIPAMIFLINFYRTRKTLKQLDRTLRFNLSSQQQRVATGKLIKTKRKTIRIIFVVCVSFFVCWTPNNVTYFLFQYGGIKTLIWNSHAYQVMAILGFSSSCINPFLYAFQSTDFRLRCRKVLRKMLDMRSNYYTPL